MIQVSVTSHRPGRTPLDAKAGFETWLITLLRARIKFEAQLSIGGWEGGREPTFVTRVKEGQLDRILWAAALFANATEQEAALVLDFSADKADAGAEPVHEIEFAQRLTTSQMLVVEKALVSVGIGGWTWTKREGRTLLQVAFIPAWAGYQRDGHYARVAAVSTALNQAGYPHRLVEGWAVPHILTADNYRNYLR